MGRASHCSTHLLELLLPRSVLVLERGGLHGIEVEQLNHLVDLLLPLRVGGDAHGGGDLRAARARGRVGDEARAARGRHEDDLKVVVPMVGACVDDRDCDRALHDALAEEQLALAALEGGARLGRALASGPQAADGAVRAVGARDGQHHLLL